MNRTRRPTLRFNFYFIVIIAMTLLGSSFYYFYNVRSHNTKATEDKQDATTTGTEKKLPKGDCSVAKFKFAEVKKHDKCSLLDPDGNDFWMIVDGNVYDLSEWVEHHPGGEQVCAGYGIDATSIFKQAHYSDAPKQILQRYCIGTLDGPIDDE